MTFLVANCLTVQSIQPWTRVRSSWPWQWIHFRCYLRWRLDKLTRIYITPAFSQNSMCGEFPPGKNTENTNFHLQWPRGQSVDTDKGRKQIVSKVALPVNIFIKKNFRFEFLKFDLVLYISCRGKRYATIRCCGEPRSDFWVIAKSLANFADGKWVHCWTELKWHTFRYPSRNGE